ncbi:class II fructose-bisphosphate aldolase [Brachybacterium alimentarium]|uniref:class II fructose-bisphosphate aldolase n=1 Tax=Brachybacterium alimentarium TaxID=47845 RepID=UPI000DF1313F|nr:class II fructose-bisphosphate aldolase [Brachybacterium alimentarium]RCS93452.1 class II fructose-bisphosphate aldolase [Brachybacterium alimentarium]
MTTSVPAQGASLTRLLDDARRGRHAVGAFNVVLLEHAEGIVAGAEAVQLPVILQISENCIRYHGGIGPIASAVQEVARAAETEVVVHLDHITDLQLVADGIALGVDSIMFDGSRLEDQANAEVTRGVVRQCHQAGIAVEAELGEVGGKDGAHAPGARTDPGAATAFIDATGIDALAVAVGTSHAMAERVAQVDTELISRLAAASSVPLVLHGSSGLSDENLRGAVGAGMTKINISTHLNGLFTRAVRSVLEDHVALTDPRKYVSAGRDAIAAESERLLSLLASASDGVTAPSPATHAPKTSR